MLNAVLVDDERPALRMLEAMLQKYPQISISGVYSDPVKALQEIERLKPQVVFLDINMPRLRGIDAASRILDLSPASDIIFVTAFDQYALEAFELNALDYLLKPVKAERLGKTIDRLLKKKQPAWPGHGLRLQIKCLGGLRISWENREPIRWRAQKTRELFAFLLHNRGRAISKGELLDWLWPEDDPEKAVCQLYNGIYYIRKALEGYGVDRTLVSIGVNYSLKLGAVDWDVDRLYELEKGYAAGYLENLEAIEAMYAGEYMEGEDYLWAYAEREKLRNIYRQCLLKQAEQYLELKQYDRAESRLIKAYAQNPYDETTTGLLLRHYLAAGEHSKAVRHFQEYARLLKEELAIEPNPKLSELYRSFK